MVRRLSGEPVGTELVPAKSKDAPQTQGPVEISPGGPARSVQNHPAGWIRLLEATPVAYAARESLMPMFAVGGAPFPANCSDQLLAFGQRHLRNISM